MQLCDLIFIKYYTLICVAKRYHKADSTSVGDNLVRENESAPYRSKRFAR